MIHQGSTNPLSVMVFCDADRLGGDAVGSTASLAFIASSSPARENTVGDGLGESGEPEADHRIADGAVATSDDLTGKPSDCLWQSRTSPGS